MRQIARTQADYYRMIGERADVIDQLNTIIRELEGEKAALAKTVEELSKQLAGPSVENAVPVADQSAQPKGAAAPPPRPVKAAGPVKPDRPAPDAGDNGPEGRPATPR